MKKYWLPIFATAVFAIPISAPNVAEAKTYKQCVHGKFGVGYVARVKWYDATKIKLNGSKLDLPKATKTKNVAVTETECHSSSKPHFMTIEAKGNEAASHVVAGVVGTLTGVAGAGLCVGIAVAGAPSVAGPCVELALDGGILAGTAVKAALPDPGIFFKGYAEKIDLTGTVWNPKAKITKRLTGLREANKLQAVCSGAKNSGTKNVLKIEFFTGKVSLGTKTISGCNKSITTWSNPTTRMTHLYITTTGDDAAWFDYIKLHGQWSGVIGQWGNKGGKGYCLSSDPKDAGPWGKKVDKSCYKKFKFDVIAKKAYGYH